MQLDVFFSKCVLFLHRLDEIHRILEDRVKSAGDVKHRFYKLLTPEFLHELKDYYYYSMLRTQGIRCLETRQTSMTIPITEISFVMRAIGYYPTEEEVSFTIQFISISLP